VTKASLNIFSALIFALIIGCGNPDQVNQKDNTSSTSDQTLPKQNNMISQKITPNLWIDNDAQAAVDYYLSIFKGGKLKSFNRYANPPEAKAQGAPDSFETAVIEIAGVEFSILAAGPYFKFNESVSFVINCKDQAEVDYYWNALTSNGGEESNCGWCKDKYGLSWQVVPIEYFELINSEDPQVRAKAMKNTMKQKKIILSELK